MREPTSSIDCTATRMYTHPYMPQPSDAQLRAHILRHPFAQLITASVEAGLHCTAVTVAPEASGHPQLVLVGHLARRNPHAAALTHASTGLLLFPGPHAYISPRWYRARPDVPTWNYVAVQARGPLEPIDGSDEVERVLRLTIDYMERAAEKPWKLDMAPPELVARLRPGVRAFRMPIARLEGTFKLSQNKTEEDRASVIAGLLATGSSENAAVAHLMSDLAS